MATSARSKNSKNRRKYRYFPMLALGLGALGLGGGALAIIHGFLNSAPAPQKKVVQEVQIIRPPPPPPDVPPPPPPPPEEKIDVPEPQQQPDPTPSNEPPPGEQLGLDTEGGAGGDAFGLAARKGGRDLLGTGGSAFAWYGNLVKGEIISQLADDKRVRGVAYSVPVRIWIRADGSVEKVVLAQSSGDRERDRAIEADIGRIRFSQAPPADEPQPLTLRFVSRS